MTFWRQIARWAAAPLQQRQCHHLLCRQSEAARVCAGAVPEPPQRSGGPPRGYAPENDGGSELACSSRAEMSSGAEVC
jgi:hypothetical protein